MTFSPRKMNFQGFFSRSSDFHPEGAGSRPLPPLYIASISCERARRFPPRTGPPVLRGPRASGARGKHESPVAAQRVSRRGTAKLTTWADGAKSCQVPCAGGRIRKGAKCRRAGSKCSKMAEILLLVRIKSSTRTSNNGLGSTP